MENKVRLTESQLRKVIKESVKKALMNEISSDLLKRARDKFSDKYGSSFTKGEMTGKLEKDQWGNPIHPKDKRLLAHHYQDFDDAIHNAEYDEEGENDIVNQARDIFFSHENDWEEEPDPDGGEPGYTLEIDGWKFWMYHWAGQDVLEYETPDGKSGSCKANKINRMR